MVTLIPPIEVVKLDPRARLPERFDQAAIGMDVFAFLLTESGRATSRAIHLKGVTEVPTGIKIRPPSGYFIQITSRLSMTRAALIVANAPAMIPPEFDSELTILLLNASHQTQYVAHEHRIAQFTLCPIIRVAVRDVSSAQHPEDVHPGPRQSHS
jgi:dUTPase